MMDLIMFVALLGYFLYEDCQRDRRGGFRLSWFKRTVHRVPHDPSQRDLLVPSNPFESTVHVR